MTAKEISIVLYNMAADSDFFDIPEECHTENIEAMAREIESLQDTETLNYCLSRIAESNDHFLKRNMFK